MAKKKLPKVLALLDEDMCTGCEACVSVCPVDCIDTLPGPQFQQVMQSCSIDLPRWGSGWRRLCIEPVTHCTR